MRKKLLVFDTESTGKPDWPAPSGMSHQPHIVQLAIGVYDYETLEQLELFEMFARPDEWSAAETIQYHGFTDDYLTSHGVAEEDLYLEFKLRVLTGDYAEIVGHSVDFDFRMMRIAAYRFENEAEANKLRGFLKPLKYCTGRNSKPIMGVTGRAMPKLVEAYKHFTGEDFLHNHNALHDVQATFAVYKGIREHNNQG